MKGGFGSYAVQVGDLKVGAIVGVNSLGDIVDPNNNNKIIAGGLSQDRNSFINIEESLLANYSNPKNVFKGNTTIGCIVTNGNFDKAQANKIASMAQNGLEEPLALLTLCLMVIQYLLFPQIKLRQI